MSFSFRPVFRFRVWFRARVRFRMMILVSFSFRPVWVVGIRGSWFGVRGSEFGVRGSEFVVRSSGFGVAFLMSLSRCLSGCRVLGERGSEGETEDNHALRYSLDDLEGVDVGADVLQEGGN